MQFDFIGSLVHELIKLNIFRQIQKDASVGQRMRYRQQIQTTLTTARLLPTKNGSNVTSVRKFTLRNTVLSVILNLMIQDWFAVVIATPITKAGKSWMITGSCVTQLRFHVPCVVQPLRARAP